MFFFKNYGVSVSARTRGGGLNQCGHLADKGEGVQFFAILCGHLLWTAPNACYVYGQANLKILA